MRIVSFIVLQTLLAGSIEVIATAVTPLTRIQASTGCRVSFNGNVQTGNLFFGRPLVRLVSYCYCTESRHCGIGSRRL